MTNRFLLLNVLLVSLTFDAQGDEGSERKFPEKERFHLFVLAGQSNMAGRGKVAKEDRKPDANILMFTKDETWVPAVDPVHFDKPIAGVGLARSFARTYLKSHPDVTIGLIPCAVGGSPIAMWQPDGFHKSTNTHPFDDAIKRIRRAKTSGEIKGILWHQGEGDSKDGLAEKYAFALKKTLTRLRDESSTNPPIVIGQMGNFAARPWNDARKMVDRAHQELARDLPRAAFVSSEGLTPKSDNVHFDRTSLIEFGVRYARALSSIQTTSEDESVKKLPSSFSTPKE